MDETSRLLMVERCLSYFAQASARVDHLRREVASLDGRIPPDEARRILDRAARAAVDLVVCLDEVVFVQLALSGINPPGTGPVVPPPQPEGSRSPSSTRKP